MTINRRHFLGIMAAAPLAPIVKPKKNRSLPRFASGVVPPLEKVTLNFKGTRSGAFVKVGTMSRFYGGKAGHTKNVDARLWRNSKIENLVIQITKGWIEIVVCGQGDTRISYSLNEGESLTID